MYAHIAKLYSACDVLRCMQWNVEDCKTHLKTAWEVRPVSSRLVPVGRGHLLRHSLGGASCFCFYCQ